MSDQNSGRRRRNVLKYIGGAGATTAGLGASSMSAVAKIETESAEAETARKFLNEPPVQHFIESYDFLDRESFSLEEATVAHASLGDREERLVLIPYQTSEAEEAELSILGDSYVTAAHQSKNSDGSTDVTYYFPPTKDGEEVSFETTVRDDDIPNGVATQSMDITPTSPLICPSGFVNLSCVYDWVESNEEVSRSCSLFVTSAPAAKTKVGAIPVIGAGIWCAWDIAHEDIDPQGCDLCTSDLDEATGAIPVEPEWYEDQLDVEFERPSADDLPSLPSCGSVPGLDSCPSLPSL